MYFNINVISIILLSFLTMFASQADARRSCCSWHGGVIGCDAGTGRLVCRDQTYSPSCTCNEPRLKKETPIQSSQLDKFVRPIPPSSGIPHWAQLTREQAIEATGIVFTPVSRGSGFLIHVSRQRKLVQKVGSSPIKNGPVEVRCLV